jgi:hypothetical protein
MYVLQDLNCIISSALTQYTAQATRVLRTVAATFSVLQEIRRFINVTQVTSQDPTLSDFSASILKVMTVQEVSRL